MNLLPVLLIILMSIIAFVAMGVDKRKARQHQYRISEKTLWIVALLGGAIGSYLGMIFFRHKTKHLNFRIGFTLLAVGQLTLLFWIYFIRDYR
ncbi:DUF1294 domain-containing protein [Paenisporosarcina quisquiliarum]|uniref:DUF1294 domain-containing protein n=1 Tax=Paenisporosarcina quisquiliarum TaxID=365346 RepID=UPI00373698F0